MEIKKIEHTQVGREEFQAALAPTQDISAELQSVLNRHGVRLAVVAAFLPSGKGLFLRCGDPASVVMLCKAMAEGELFEMNVLGTSPS